MTKPLQKQAEERNRDVSQKGLKQSALASAKELDQLLKGQAPFGGWTLELVGKRRGTHSEILEYQNRSRAGDAPLAMKRITASSPPGKAAELVSREFQAIETAWRLAGQALEGSLPKPLVVLPEAGLMVTEKLPGIPLSWVLRREANCLMALFHTPNVCESACRVGVWLSRFHEVTRQPALVHDAQVFEREVTQLLEDCMCRGLDAAAAQEIFRVASRGSRLVDGQPIPAAARHGDFTARNILIDGDRIGVVDFENFAERDTIYEDVSKFVAYLALLKGRPGYSRTALNAATRCFLRGYDSSADSELVGLFALKAAVRIFALQGTRRILDFLGFDKLYMKGLITLGREHGRRLDLRQDSRFQVPEGWSRK
ncbi:MAG: hypothetical protein DMG97_00075 [Acidobacteria bacterium]|nr:MAG: hypothetical protein DMG97_00075 [Acidobacteriota bacterium]